jgi:repressor LexA
MSAVGLTSQMVALLGFIRDYHREKGVFPSFEEMKLAMGLGSKAGIHRLLLALEERGHIRRLAGRARAMMLVDHPATDGRGALEAVLAGYDLTAETRAELEGLLGLPEERAA